MPKVLVTGGSGFLGSHCILRLLAADHEVRTTVRDLAKVPEVRSMLAAGGAKENPPLNFIEADLMADASWHEAVSGCEYVLHVASRSLQANRKMRMNWSRLHGTALCGYCVLHETPV